MSKSFLFKGKYRRENFVVVEPYKQTLFRVFQDFYEKI
jgi:hypothetical protein